MGISKQQTILCLSVVVVAVIVVAVNDFGYPEKQKFTSSFCPSLAV